MGVARSGVVVSSDSLLPGLTNRAGAAIVPAPFPNFARAWTVAP